jgi:competence protein ComEC
LAGLIGQRPARWLVAVATTGAGVPDAAVHWPGGGWWGALASRSSPWRCSCSPADPGRAGVGGRALALVLSAAPSVCGFRLAADGAVVIACDVGQGDALVLPDAPGGAVVVDGSEPAP